MIPSIILFSIFSTLVSAYSLGKIAIIGAGAGGSSASFHLQKFTDKGYNITIFERNHYVGGRSTTIKNLAPALSNYEYELGASVFTSDNIILTNAVADFNLSVYDTASSIPTTNSDRFKGTTGAWNGDKYIYYYTDDEVIIGADAPSSAEQAQEEEQEEEQVSLISEMVTGILDDFIQSYYYDEFPYGGLTNITQDTGLVTLTGSTALELLTQFNVSEDFCKEYIEPGTRVNYASNVDEITSLEALVSLDSASSIYSVKGGNFQIFEKFIESSGADLRLNTSINRIKYNTTGSYILEVADGNGSVQLETFDKVIIAAPFYQTNIKVNVDLKESIPAVHYRDLYVTIVSSKAKIDNELLNEELEAPETLMTTSVNSEDLPNDLEYFSMTVKNYDSETNEYLYKLFTPEAVDKLFISKNFFNNLSDFEIVIQQYWNPYPYSKPTTEFPDFQIDIHGGIYYLNTMEQFISTMETSALAGANVAGLIANGLNTTLIELAPAVNLTTYLTE